MDLPFCAALSLVALRIAVAGDGDGSTVEEESGVSSQCWTLERYAEDALGWEGGARGDIGEKGDAGERGAGDTGVRRGGAGEGW